LGCRHSHSVKQAALGLFFNGSEQLPNPSFVNDAYIDNGFSRKADGADYPPSWNGQSPLDAYYISSILHGRAPGDKNSAFSTSSPTQNEDGEVDNKPVSPHNAVN